MSDTDKGQNPNKSGGGWSTDGLGYLQDKQARQRVYVLHPHVSESATGPLLRSPSARLEEAMGLTAAIDVDLIGGELAPLRTIRPRTYLGEGKIQELKSFIKHEEIDLCVFDCELSPGQQRNLERALHTKVIDRTALILEIFGARASTKEGELQVELAHLTYQKSRLVRSWTHLERQRGGGGFLGGPGETQIESDRRIISDRISRIRKQLENVTRTRGLHRARRQKAPYPVVSLVGYTNAGKSTLFNRLTDAEVLAEDMLFATLDPTLRAIDLPSGRKIMLSDTVGFISELPTMLVAAFRATLEEVLEADVIVHVRDAAHQDSDVQKQDVLDVLTELGVELDSGEESTPVIEVFNKADLLDDESQQTLENIVARREDAALVSGLTGAGCESFIESVDALLKAQDYHLTELISYSDGATQSWLHAHAQIISEKHGEGGIEFEFTVDPIAWDRFRKRS